MFIKGLNSNVNAVEAHRRHKTKRSEIEKRLSRGFWLLSQMMKDRVLKPVLVILYMTIYLCQVTLARECVLTGFSIYPSQEMFEKIVEMAIHSGLDKIGLDGDEEEKEEKEDEDDDEKKSRHCRVTDFKKPTYSARCVNIINFH